MLYCVCVLLDLLRTVDQRIIVNVDATFTIVPELVFQLYTIHGYTNAGFISFLPVCVSFQLNLLRAVDQSKNECFQTAG